MIEHKQTDYPGKERLSNNKFELFIIHKWKKTRTLMVRIFSIEHILNNKPH